MFVVEISQKFFQKDRKEEPMSKFAKTISQFGWAILVIALFISGAESAEIIAGSRSEPSIDPHFLYLSSNLAYSRHIYGSLVERDEAMRKVPSLATSWKTIDDTTWEFELRRGVKFHDGTEFTAEDVAFSIKRIPNVPNNPAPYTSNIRSIISTEIVNPYTIRIKTDKVNPLLPAQLPGVIIVSKRVAEKATTADFSSGKAAIGTGPFKFSKYIPGDRLVLERNPDYWGNKPAWDRVTFRIISNDAARVAALLGGTVDIIDYVPPTEVSSLEKNRNIRVFKRPTNRIIYFQLDHDRDRSPFVTQKDGKPLDKNPLKDRRVRKAISMAIDREAICKHVMAGLAKPECQLTPEGFFGYNPEIRLEKYDPAGAKKLLAEAGYPDGFGLTVHGPNDRYVNDSKICEAVGQMLARIGLAIKVDTMPKSIYWSRMSRERRELSFMLLGVGIGSGEATESLMSVMRTYDKKLGLGSFNRVGYTNPELDRVIDQAGASLNEEKREKLARKAMAIGMDDYAVIPLHSEFTIAAARKGLTFIPKADEEFLLMNVQPAP
jgi:peptide/nickel transport system substrate-binding protein